jgi:cobalamin biosynthesis protein CobT
MIKNLVKAAADLDRAGFHVEADLMDKIMQKIAEDLAEDDANDNEFGFLGSDHSDDEDDSADSDDDSEEGHEEEEGEEEEEEDSSDHSVEECLTYCSSFSHEEKVELIKALLDSMM